MPKKKKKKPKQKPKNQAPKPKTQEPKTEAPKPKAEEPKLNPQSKPKPQEPKPQSKLILLAKVLLAIVTLPAAIFVLMPDVTATVSDPVDPRNPFSASATITNTGYLPLISVRPLLGLKKITSGNPKFPSTIKGSSEKEYARLEGNGWPVPYLWRNDKTTLALDEIWQGQPDMLSADIAVIVAYRSPLTPWKREKIVPFSAVKQTNGNFYWYATTGDTIKRPDPTRYAMPRLP